jgi:hypothetical protein
MSQLLFVLAGGAAGLAAAWRCLMSKAGTGPAVEDSAT